MRILSVAREDDCRIPKDGVLLDHPRHCRIIVLCKIAQEGENEVNDNVHTAQKREARI